MQKGIDVEYSARQVPPKNAVVALQCDFARFAGNLRHNDRALQEDLVQEMSLGVLQCTESHTLAFFRSRGLSRARDFLKMWRRKSCEDWTAITQWPIASLDSNERGSEWYLEKIGALMMSQEMPPALKSIYDDVSH